MQSKARFQNQLEPSSLVAQFAAHPPEGFALLGDGSAPAFAAPFDLLTSADDDLKQRVRSWPLHARWSRWLTLRTAFVGTTVTEYALMPVDADAGGLAAQWRRDLGRRHQLTIVKDIPQRSPLLSAAENGFADALAEACTSQGFVMVVGQALAFVAIDFADVDQYLQRLSTSRRKNLKRKLKSLDGLDVHRVSTGPAFADDVRVDAYYALYEAVYAQSDVHFDKLSRDFFAAVLRDRSNGGMVFEYRARGDADGALIGWNLCFESGGKLIDKYIGLAYPAAREHNLYFVSWFVNLRFAIERGLTHYVAGWTDPEVKAQLGASFTFTRHAVFVRNPLLRAIGRRLAGRFEGDRQVVEALS